MQVTMRGCLCELWWRLNCKNWGVIYIVAADGCILDKIMYKPKIFGWWKFGRHVKKKLGRMFWLAYFKAWPLPQRQPLPPLPWSCWICALHQRLMCISTCVLASKTPPHKAAHLSHCSYKAIYFHLPRNFTSFACSICLDFRSACSLLRLTTTHV